MATAPRKPLYWIASSLKDLKALPVPVQKTFGTALRDVRFGDTPEGIKPLKGFGGASVVEILEDFDRSTYRAVYTVAFSGIVYVLHVFQKKAKHGIATPKHDVDLIKRRYDFASQHYQTLAPKKDHHAEGHA